MPAEAGSYSFHYHAMHECADGELGLRMCERSELGCRFWRQNSSPSEFRYIHIRLASGQLGCSRGKIRVKVRVKVSVRVRVTS